MSMHKSVVCLFVLMFVFSFKFGTKLILLLEMKNKTVAMSASCFLPPGEWNAGGGLEEGIRDLYKREKGG